MDRMFLFKLSCLILLLLAGHSAQFDIEYFYSIGNDKDGDFVVSQLAPELKNEASPAKRLFVVPFGGVNLVADESGKYTCKEGDMICEASLIHFCFTLPHESELLIVDFLSCYYQSELYPTDLSGASQQCIVTLAGEIAWDKASSCTRDNTWLSVYAEMLRNTMKLRPLILQTPYVFLHEQYYALASVDLRKAICRVEAEDIWECESVDKYKEPKVDIFYSLDGEEAGDFFLSRFNQTDLELVESAALLVSIIPNPNKIIDCDSSDSNCWSHQAHWCVYENTAVSKLSFIHCTLQGKGKKQAAEDLVKGCLPNGQYESLIKPCIADIASSTVAVKHLQAYLNALIEPTLQTSLEITIRDQLNVKAKNGVLEELCSNVFTIDNETLGCKVTKSTVQIFYETQNSNLEALFNQFKALEQYSPFETIMDIELVPYGKTVFGSDGTFTCSKGDNQCQANWIHACLIKERFNSPSMPKATDHYQVLQFIDCTLNDTDIANPVEQARECLKKVYEDGEALWTTLDTCVQTDSALKEEMRTKTEQISLTQIPEIVIDGVKKTSETGSNLLVSLCQSFSPIKPRVCLKIDAASQQMLQMVIFLTGDTATQQFVQSQIKPLLTSEPRDASLRLRDVIEWTFVPWGPSQYNSTSGEIVCATGANECLVNRILTCATRQQQNGFFGHREDRQRVASFLVCFFDSANWQNNPLDAANQCAGKLSPLDSFPLLWQCALQNSKQQLMLDMKDLTENNSPAMGKFPEVTIQAERQEDITKLRESLCSYYKVPSTNSRPAECPVVTVPPPTVPLTTLNPSTTPTPGGNALTSQVSTFLVTFTTLFVLYRVA